MFLTKKRSRENGNPIKDVYVIRLELESNKQSKSLFLNIFQPRAYMDQLKGSILFHENVKKLS